LPEELSTVNINFGSRSHALYFRPKSSDEGVIRQVFSNRDYDLKRLARYADLAQLLNTKLEAGKRPLIVDAGANIGVSVLYFLSKFQNAAVVAIEPEESNYQLLLKNVHGLGVECIHGALSSTGGYMSIVDPGKGFWGFRTEATADPNVGVPCVTLDQIYEKRAAKDVWPFLVKIDIEGGEGVLFEQNTSWIDKTPIIIVELHDWLLSKAGTSRSFLRCIAEHDRDFVFLGENVYSIKNDLENCL
jgi:FkbM family methyltransferase